MAEHLERGKAGEELAVQYLFAKGWNILERNWRSGHREIDIIAETGGWLVIVEVKMRWNPGGEWLEEILPRSKQQNLIRAAASYLVRTAATSPGRKPSAHTLRFDLVLITGEPGKQTIEHVEDAFCGWDL